MAPWNGLVLGACMLVFSSVSTGCHQGQTQMTQQEGTAEFLEQGAIRSAVPLIRAVDSQMLDRPIEFEFDVPAQASDTESPIFIGLRVGAANPGAVAEAADRLLDAGITARVHLFRLGAGAPEAVALGRSEWVDRSEVQTVAVAADGGVPGLFATDADFASMREAGLLPAQVDYREFEFAFIRDTPPGRYRVVLELKDPGQVLLAEKAELLIAYSAKSK